MRSQGLGSRSADYQLGETQQVPAKHIAEKVHPEIDAA